jgi:hypothetical protein
VKTETEHTRKPQDILRDVIIPSKYDHAPVELGIIKNRHLAKSPGREFGVPLGKTKKRANKTEGKPEKPERQEREQRN